MMLAKSVLLPGAWVLALGLGCSNAEAPASSAVGNDVISSGGTTSLGGGATINASGGSDGDSAGQSNVTNASGGSMTTTGGVGNGSGGSMASSSGANDERLFVPEDLPVTNLNGEGRAVNVIAATLIDGPSGLKLYAALRNDGDVWACDGSVSFELFNVSDESVGAWVGGLYASQLFRRSDGMGGLIACVGPGESAMVGLTNLPETVVIDELAAALYQLTYFNRDVLPFDLIPVDSISVSEVDTIAQDSAVAFTGTLDNGLDVAMTDAMVTLFPLNGVGRPLGMVTSNSTGDVPPGGSWSFETAATNDPGVDHIAYPSGSVTFE